jgi:excisionase family DNA binding protein
MSELTEHIKLFRAAEVAETLHVRRDTIYKWCRRGKLGFHKGEGVKGCILISLKDVQDYLAKTRREIR